MRKNLRKGNYGSYSTKSGGTIEESISDFIPRFSGCQDPNSNINGNQGWRT